MSFDNEIFTLEKNHQLFNTRHSAENEQNIFPEGFVKVQTEWECSCKVIVIDSYCASNKFSLSLSHIFYEYHYLYVFGICYYQNGIFLKFMSMIRFRREWKCWEGLFFVFNHIFMMTGTNFVCSFKIIGCIIL